jgi:tRNA wybutosine-synthesizing protein 1
MENEDLSNSLPTMLTQILRKQKYHIVGNHSAVKGCRWLHEALVHNRPCYKQKFYGIKTHQCIQMTPVLYNCTQKCLFCWRAQTSDVQNSWDETKVPKWDLAEMIIDGSIKEQLRILSGYRDNPKVDKRKLREALNPRHVAISLAGEPTLYTHLGELIEMFHKKGFTTFLVSNGTMPSALAEIDCEPTQLYVSLCAPDRETFNRVCRPQVDKAWEKLNQTLMLLHNFRCPTVIRITLAKSTNMMNVKGYADIIRKADPTYVEPTGYMHVGFSRLRLSFEATPSHAEISEFARELSLETGYGILDESVESRVVLLSKLQTAVRLSR